MNTPTVQSNRQGQQTPSPMDLIGNSFILEPNNRAEFVHGLQRRIELEESRRRQQQQQQQQQQQGQGATNSNSLGVGNQQQAVQQPMQSAQPTQPLERIQSLLQQQVRQQQEEVDEELQLQQQSHRPCLSCMMRALQASGMINACWSAAFAELEEAFAIKRVADVMTGDSSGAAAADADSAVGTVGQQQRQRQQQQKRQQQQQQQQQQRQKGQASVRHQPEPTKWQALESLCAMISDLGACTHRTSLSGGT